MVYYLLLSYYTGCPKKNGTRVNNYVCIKNEIRV